MSGRLPGRQRPLVIDWGHHLAGGVPGHGPRSAMVTLSADLRRADRRQALERGSLTTRAVPPVALTIGPTRCRRSRLGSANSIGELGACRYVHRSASDRNSRSPANLASINLDTTASTVSRTPSSRSLRIDSITCAIRDKAW